MVKYQILLKMLLVKTRGWIKPIKAYMFEIYKSVFCNNKKNYLEHVLWTG